MADSENEETEEKSFCIERAKTGRAKCKKCKNNIDTGSLRLAKLVMNPFGTGKMKNWYHVPCLFEAFKKQRATTAKIEKIDDMSGYETVADDDIEEILKYLPDEARTHWEMLRKGSSIDTASVDSPSKKKAKAETVAASSALSATVNPSSKDNSLRQFRKICSELADESSYLQKTKILKTFFEKGSNGSSFEGDLLLWCCLLLPGAVKTVYNLQSKQLVKIFSRIFDTDVDDMLVHLEEGDVAVTICEFFQKSETVKPATKSTLTLPEVNEYLQRLSKLTKEEDQQHLLRSVCERCTANDLQIFVRFIKHDLRINAGPKHILDALHPDAYEAYKTCRDINNVVKEITAKNTGKDSLTIAVKLLTPVQPMLAEACTSLKETVNKYQDGLYAEIKYDGERVQLHKQGSDFKYFSRSLKPVLSHKVNHFQDYIKRAFPSGNDLILDCEVLMIDMSTGNPLPFGTLGKHKKNEFKDANPCLFIFDCLYYNGQSLLNSPLKKRREVLQKNMNEIKNHIEFSKIKMIRVLKDLESMLMDVLDKGLEGLVLKDPAGVYESGKRHWIKVKRDYLFEGKAADTVDLLVLGAWYGTGHKGGMMNVFLMGCYNPADKTWRSVTKVHGHDDETLKALQTELDVVKISRDMNLVPKWLNITKTMVPDFIARDPKKMPVWEICGHEFTKHDVHTANGISIRFPRVVKIRHDKTWETATTLPELQHLFEVSKTEASSRIRDLFNKNSGSETTSSPVKKRQKKGSKDSKINEESILSFVQKQGKRKLKAEENKDNRGSKKASPNKENEDVLRSRKIFPAKPLPNMLVGKCIKISSAAASEFRRHFIAYGAEVVQTDTEKATHKLVPGSFSIGEDDQGERIMKIQLQKIVN